MQDETTGLQPMAEETTMVSGQEPVAEPKIEKKPPFFQFNFNTLLGSLALMGVVFLLVVRFACPVPVSPAPVLPVQKASGKSLSVVFVNTDSLNVHYDFVKSLRNDLESTGKRLQTEVLSEQEKLEKEGAEFQKQMASNQITEEKARQVYEQLMQRQQVLMEKKERYTQQVAEMELRMNIRLIDSVTAFLKRFNRSYQFDYIFGYKTAGEILVANDTLDITNVVLEELNKEYGKHKK